MPVCFALVLECRLMVAKCTSTILDLCRVFEVVDDLRCMLEDMFDRYSS